MQKSIYKEILDKLPGSRINGMRAFVLRKLGIIAKYPSMSRINEMRDILDDFEVDYSDSDNTDGDLMVNEQH